MTSSKADTTAHTTDLGDSTQPASTPPKSEGTALSWVLALFGTAMGAGILFLPLQAGAFGFWPLAFATVIIFPLVYFSHRTYARIVAGAPAQDYGLDILELVRKYLGRNTGLFVALMYSLANIPTVFIYAISVTNAIDSFIVNQLHGPSINRWVLSVLCVGTLTGIFAIGRKPMLWLAQILAHHFACSNVDLPHPPVGFSFLPGRGLQRRKLAKYLARRRSYSPRAGFLLLPHGGAIANVSGHAIRLWQGHRKTSLAH